MIQFYFNAAPNPMKVALLLEELGIAYEARPVDTRKGQQFAPDFLKVNPNAKVPALVDGDAVVFDSNAILLYLAGKTGRFVPPVSDAAGRAAMLSWPAVSGRFRASRCTFGTQRPSPRTTRSIATTMRRTAIGS